MRHCLLLLSVIILFTTAVSSCKKEDEGYTQALVIATNDLTPSGCGYLLRFTNGTLVKPMSLASAFQHDTMAVLIKYTNTGTQTNCAPQTPYDIISVDEIKRER